MLLDAGLEPNTNCATRAIGYRQALEFLVAAHAEWHQEGQALPGGVLSEARVVRSAAPSLRRQCLLESMCSSMLGLLPFPEKFQVLHCLAADPACP